MTKANFSFDRTATQTCGPLLRPNAAARYLGISVPTFYRLVQSGRLPKLLKIGPRATGIPKSWLDQVIANSVDQ